VLGKEMSPQAILEQWQAAQDAVFRTKFAQGRWLLMPTGHLSGLLATPLATGGNRSDGYPITLANQYVDS
jgi:hypothetical protein